VTAGQRVLINGAGGAVGGRAVRLAKQAGAYVIATAGPHSTRRVTDAGADEVIDHMTADVVATVSRPVDVVLTLAPVEPAQLDALLCLIRPGGVLVNTIVRMPAPTDETRGVRGIDLFVHSDAEQLSHLADLIDRGELRSRPPAECRWPSCHPCTPTPPPVHCPAARSSRPAPDAHRIGL
jgi:NADPH:quinone reductase-like Zn-dependent oxidoreductase